MSDQTWAQRLQRNRALSGNSEEAIKLDVLSDDQIRALSVEQLEGALFLVMDNGEAYGYTPQDGILAEKYWAALSAKTRGYQDKDDFYQKKKRSK